MAFNNLIIRLTSEVAPLLAPGSTVIEMGKQTFSAKRDSLPRLKGFLERNSIEFDQNKFSELERWVAAGDQDSLTAVYFEMLGFSAYDSIDVNSLHGSLIMDLNYDLKEKYGFKRQFDLVTNNGAGEHIFDQCSVFQNVHELTKPRGIMIHCLPCNNYINHGFFSFSPLFFMDLAAVNNYDILKITVGSSSGYETGYVSGELPASRELAGPQLSLEDLQARVSDRRTLKQLFALFASTFGLKNKPHRLKTAVRGISRQQSKTLVAATLRKRENAPFRKPIQGRYGGENIESDSLREDYVA